jgi:hypothetical protein
MHRNLAIALVSISSTLFMQGMPAQAISQITSDKSAATTVSEIEKKLFFHPYTNEANNERLNRLELFMFGATQEGRSDNERVQNISSAAQSLLCAPRQKKSVGLKPAVSQESADAAKPVQRYTRVSELEERVFAQTFESDSLKVRVSRLETKAFGRSFDDRDLALRVDDLDRCTSLPPVLTSSRSSSIYFSLPHSPRIQPIRFISVVDHIEILEKSVYGKTFSEKTLQKRVADLEKSIMGATLSTPNETITNRVAQLWQKLSVVGAVKTQNG